MKPPKISSATISNTSGRSSAPCGTPSRSTEIQRSEVTCPKQTPRELQHHQLQSTATNSGQKFLRHNISAMLSWEIRPNAFLRSSCAMNTGMFHSRASSVQRSIMYTASAPCLCGMKAVCSVSFSNQMYTWSLRKKVRQLIGRNSLRPLGCGFLGMRHAMTRNQVS